MHASSIGALRASVLVLCGLLAPALAFGQDAPPGTEPPTQSAPSVPASTKIEGLNGTYKVADLVEWYAGIKKKNYVVLGDGKDLNETVRIVSHKDVTFGESERAMISALELAGYTMIEVGGVIQVIKSGDAIKEPGLVTDGEIPYTAAYVTQIIRLSNVSVSDVTSVVTTLSSSDAKIIAYAPTNTLIITDSAYNLRKTYKILMDLDVAAPRSTLEIVPVLHADAAEIASIIEQLYAVGDEPSADTTSRSARTRTTVASRRARRDEPVAAEETPGVAGEESQFISKVLSDDRTNSLIVLANDQGHEAIRKLLEELDTDVDMSSRSQIHVVYLQHAKAEDVATVLAQLSENGTTSRPRAATTTTTTGRTGTRATTTRTGAADTAAVDESSGGVLAAFDSGMRITHDENTNSLVIIAAPDDFEVVNSVIKKLDVRRRQVFVDAVLLEIASEDTNEFGAAVHGPFNGLGDNSVGFLGAQLGASSLGLTQDLLSGLAVGVFGDTIDVPFTTSSGTSTVSVPAFGIVLSALKSNSLVNIVSNPNLMTLDNEEAEIVVGRKIPFPTSSGLNSLGQPVVSFQREDVATTLKITPRINSENFVTLEINVEVSDIEEDSQGLDVNQAGFITSKREIKTVALVGDNETVVLGGLVGMTDTQVETKIPILGDLPLIGALFRGSRDVSRKSNLLIFLTPHIIDDEDDMAEIMKVKQAQRQEYVRRFYGKSKDEQMKALDDLLEGSMNVVGRPSMYQGNPPRPAGDDEDPYGFGDPSDETRDAIQDSLAVPVEPLPETNDLPEDGN